MVMYKTFGGITLQRKDTVWYGWLVGSGMEICSSDTLPRPAPHPSAPGAGSGRYWGEGHGGWCWLGWDLCGLHLLQVCFVLVDGFGWFAIGLFKGEVKAVSIVLNDFTVIGVSLVKWLN